MISSTAFNRLKAGFERGRLDFIEMELQVGATFVQVAETSAKAGISESAIRNVAHAREALKQARKIFAGIRTMEQSEADRYTDSFWKLERSIAELVLKINTLVLAVISYYLPL